MRSPILLLALTLGGVSPAAGLALDLPVRMPGSASTRPGPAYRGDLVELRLAPQAARRAATRTAGRLRAEALGVAAIDRLAAALGGAWFEPLFRGETPPPAGSDEPDLTAFYVAHLPAGVALEAALEAFQALPEVTGVSPIAILPVDGFPNDSLWSVSTWLYQPATRRDIHAPEAWDVTTGDTTIVVAVLDTGVLPYHPDLGGTVAGQAGQIWTNRREAAGIPGVDDDGNGYVDDLHGWDFVTGAPDGLPGEDADVEDNDPNDFAGHGTQVAGLVGALTDNGIGVAGTAWRVRLMPVRMGWASTFSPTGEVQMDFAARAIRYATRMGAHVINCSWASANTNGIDAAVAAAVRAGATVVSAAGNSGAPRYLAERDDVLGIAATDSTDRLAPFSNRGAYVDLAAPGVGLRSTALVRTGPDSLGSRQPAYTALLNGTSFAAPLVSGAVALLQSQRLPPRANHLLTPRGVQLRLMETADDIAAFNPTTVGLYGAGRLNAWRALTETSGSSAFRTRARSTGAPVILPASPHPRVAFTASNRTLVQLDAVTGDTLLLRPLGSAPVGDVAAADLGGGVGSALFVATSSTGVDGVLARGAPLPGTWPQAGSAPWGMTGPALGDLDGDGILEIVSGADDGQLWAWHVDGSVVAGYPAPIGLWPIQAPPALSDLDGTPGVEVIVAEANGTVHALGAGGVPLPGWPVALGIANPRAPVVTRLGSDREPTVIVAAGNQLHALSPAGLPRAGFPVTLGGTVAHDPALADLDGDGCDEIVVTTFGPSRIEVRDSVGTSLGALNWPRPVAGTLVGPPVLGELSSASPGPELLVYRNSALLALERDGDSLAIFPRPGGAGISPSLGQADGDAATEVVAGTGSDSLFYLYDAGAGSLASGSMPWPTARGNFARTGSRLYAPVAGSAPAPVRDLRVAARTDSSISLRWTATGGDGSAGRPRFYVVRAARQPLDEAGFADAPLQRVVAATVDAGGTEYLVVFGLSAATRYWFALKAVDDDGNLSLLSNVLATQTEVGGPLRGRIGIALAVQPQPARGVAEFFWQGADGAGASQSIHLFDVRGRRLRVLELGSAPGGRRTWDGRDAEGRSVPAGLYYARLLSGSLHAQTRLVLLP